MHWRDKARVVNKIGRARVNAGEDNNWVKSGVDKRGMRRKIFTCLVLSRVSKFILSIMVNHSLLESRASLHSMLDGFFLTPESNPMV